MEKNLKFGRVPLDVLPKRGMATVPHWHLTITQTNLVAGVTDKPLRVIVHKSPTKSCKGATQTALLSAGEEKATALV